MARLLCEETLILPTYFGLAGRQRRDNRFYPRSVSALLLIWMTVSSSVSVLAQAEEHPAPQADLHAAVAFADVYVNDSFDATDAISKAEHLAARSRWEEAARILHEAAGEAAGRLVRVEPGHYVSAEARINRIIAQWPADGLNAYRGLYERSLEDSLRTLPSPYDLNALLRLFHRYFCSAGAARLAGTIGQLSIESGDFALAEKVYRDVLTLHPDREAYRVEFETMLSLVGSLTGMQETPRGALAKARLRWKGQERNLDDVLSEVRQRFETQRSARLSSEWPMFSGSSLRNERGTTDMDDLGLLWQYDLDPSRSGESTHDHRPPRERARRLSMQPVVAGGLVIVQRFREVVALHRNTGALAWRFRADDSMSPSVPSNDQPSGWDAPTVHQKRVYVSLPGEAVPYYSYESARSPPELVCLDLQTGNVLWRTSSEQIEDEFSETTFDSSPLVRHGKLFIVGRRRRSFGFEDCFLFRLDAETGKQEFRTHLGSGSTGSFGSRRATTAIAALEGATAYVCTNLGTVAAVSVHTGSVHWLRLYRRRTVRREERLGTATREVLPWHFNPVMVSSGLVFASPADGADVLVFRATDGTLIRTVPTKDIGDMDTLYTVDERTICGVGKNVTCYDFEDGRVSWSAAFSSQAMVFGRGMGTGHQILIPTLDSLLVYDVGTDVKSELPWGAEGSGGNLIALPDQLLVAGESRVLAYVRRSQIWDRLRRRMAESPDDPMPAMEFAEIALSNGAYDEGIEVLKEAVHRASRSERELDLTLKQRLFDDIMTFAERLQPRGLLDTTLANQLFGYASQFPPSKSAHLSYRFRFGTLFERMDFPTRAIRLYQQVLRDQSLRELPADEAGHRTIKASREAQRRIETLIAKHDRDVFEPFEDEARRLLARGRAQQSVEELKRVVTVFPNSLSAPQALIAHADLLSNQGSYLSAADLLVQAYHRYPEGTDRPALLRGIADAYEQSGDRERAYLWLTKALRVHPSEKIEYKGKRLTFAQYRDRLAQVRHLVEATRPDLNLPLSTTFRQEFKDEVTLLPPWFGVLPGNDWSRFFVQVAGGIQALDARTGLAQWARPVTVGERVGLLFARQGTAVFASSGQVFGVDIATGRIIWEHDGRTNARDRQDADWEDQDPLRLYAVHRGRLAIARQGGQVTVFDAGDGREIWSRTFPGSTQEHLALSDSLLVLTDKDAEQQVIVTMVDAQTGSVRGSIETGMGAAVKAVRLTLDGQVILATTRAISAFDPVASTLRWRVALNRDLRTEAFLIDIDALYFSDDGRRIRKLSLDDGEQLWESQSLARRHEGLRIGLVDGSIIVMTNGAVQAIDAVTGLTLWEGTPPEKPRFTAQFLTSSYVVTIHRRDHAAGQERVAYFYDHRKASGVIPVDGGALGLECDNDIRLFLAVDGALIAQTEHTILGWTAP